MTPAVTDIQNTEPGARANQPIIVRRLGRSEYLPVLEAMRAFTAARGTQGMDEIWLVEHPSVYTLGISGRREHLLRASAIPVVQTERGGQVTYHGPGQAVVYPLIDLRRRNIKVREFVHAIEAAVIATLAAYNVHGVRKLGAPGIYVKTAAEAAVENAAATAADSSVAEMSGTLDKIAALGLRVRNGCTFHGVSLNVNMDLTPFSWINPCGQAGLRTIDLATLGAKASVDEVAERLAQALIAEIDNQTHAL